MTEEKDNKVENSTEKIQALREMIYNAEKTLQGAKARKKSAAGRKFPWKMGKTAGLLRALLTAKL